MAPSVASTWRSFWHTMTSDDRHASHDSPYRTGQHVPLAQSRHAPLTSVATTAFESRADLTSPYGHDEEAANGFISSSNRPMSPNSPYSPGMRSAMRTQSSDNTTYNAGEIQMQNFSEGLPPPPPVSHSWKRIDRWAEDNYEELFDNLGEGCTQNDVNELEHELDCSLPMDVRESLQIHDGQERGGLPTGIIFGCMLLDCEEIAQEWQNWRKVSDEYLTQRTPNYRVPQAPIKAFGIGGTTAASPSSSKPPSPPQQQSGNPLWRQDLLARQDSQPAGAVQKAYAHPAWIPLARDWGGNYLAVDLAPGPAGRWGQVIIYGRDYDCKYVVARSWAAFLAAVADDFARAEKVWVDEETGELRLREFARQNVEPPYLEILRWRCDQKYGRKGPRRRPGGGGGGGNGGPGALHINASVGAAAAAAAAGPQSAGSYSNGASPYGSPTSERGEGFFERGRSAQRFAGGAAAVAGKATASPRPHLSSPLARVAEETPAPIRVHTAADSGVGVGKMDGGGGGRAEKLVNIDTPRVSDEMGKFPALDGAVSEKGSGRGSEEGSEKGRKGGVGRLVDEMKTVEI